MSKKEDLKQQILQLTREYYNEVHKTSKVFEPGKSFVNYGGRYFNDEEMVNLVDSSLDFWLTGTGVGKRTMFYPQPFCQTGFKLMGPRTGSEPEIE